MFQLQASEVSSFPLDAYPLVRTRDLEEAQAAVSKEIEPHRFYCANSEDVGDATINCARLPRTRLFGVHLGTNVIALAPPSSLQLVVPLSGEMINLHDSSNLRACPGEGLIQIPGSTVNLLWATNCTAVVVWVAREAMQEFFPKLFGHPIENAREFLTKVDLTRGAGMSVVDALRTILLELEDPESLLSRGVTTDKIEEILLTSVLYTAYSGGDANEIEQGGNRPRSIYFKRALEFVHAHLRESFSAADVAQAAGVSLRTLQYEFSSHLGMGPMTMVRRERLRGAQDELRRSLVGGTTVADVAARWGFLDTKYFSRLYHREFGECPSATLRKPPAALLLP